MTDSFHDLMQREEPLHPDLAPYVAEETFPMLRHPLLYMVPYFGAMAAYANAVYAAKQAEAAAARAEGNFRRYIWLHERPYRVSALFEVAGELSDDGYWRQVREVYQDAENVEEVPDIWASLLTSPRPGRSAMMNAAELSIFAALPDTLTVWRGAADVQELDVGFSWTLDIEVAHWFACRFDQAGIVARGEVAKANVLAYLATRGEEEIMVPAGAVARQAIEPAKKRLARAAHRKKLDIFSDAQP